MSEEASQTEKEAQKPESREEFLEEKEFDEETHDAEDDIYTEEYWEKYDYDEPAARDTEYWNDDIDIEATDAQAEAARRSDMQQHFNDVHELLATRGGIQSDENVALYQKRLEVAELKAMAADAAERGDHENAHRYDEFAKMSQTELNKLPNPRLNKASRKLTDDMEDLINIAVEDTALDWNNPRLQDDCRAMCDSFNRSADANYIYLVKQANQYDENMQTSFEGGFSGEDVMKVPLRNRQTAAEFSRAARDRGESVFEHAYRMHLLPRSYDKEDFSGVEDTDDPEKMSLEQYEAWRKKQGGVSRRGDNFLDSLFPAKKQAKGRR